MEEKKVAKKKLTKKKKSAKAARIKTESENIEQSEPESENIQFAEYVTANVMELFNSLKQGLNKLNKSNQSLKEQIVQQQAASQHEQSEAESNNAEYVTADVMERLNSLKQGLDQLDKSNQSLKEQIVQQQAASQREQSEAESEHIQYTEYVAANVLEPLHSLKQGLDQLDKSNQTLKEQIVQQQAASQREQSEAESRIAEHVTADVMEPLHSLKQGLDQLDKSNQSLKEQIVRQQAASHRQNPLLKIIILLLGIGIITLGYSSIKTNSRMNESIGIDSNDMNSYEIGYAFGIKMAKLLPGINLNEVVSGMCDILSEVDTSLINAGICPDQPATADNQTHANTSALPQIPAPSDAFKDDFAALNTTGNDGESGEIPLDDNTETDAILESTVVTLTSGVQYKVLKAGSGAQPQAGDEVVISYQTYLDDGTVFGSTGNDGGSRQIALDEIKVPGLKQALLLMNEGSRWKVTVPPNMGFTQSGNRTLRRSNLTYDIELISVE